MINISFDFDPSNHSITNINVIEKETSGFDKVVAQMKEVIQPTPSKPKTTRSKKSKDESIIKLEENKLTLTQSLLDLINATPGDRLCVQFKEFNGVYSPIIAKSEVFADPEAGNKLTKSLTISYRGKQRDQLVIYGEEFTFEETFEGSQICRLIGKTEVKADDKVFKGNTDLDPYKPTDKLKSDIKKENVKIPKENMGINFSYTSELPNTKTVANPSDVDINVFDFKDSNDLDSLVNDIFRDL